LPDEPLKDSTCDQNDSLTGNQIKNDKIGELIMMRKGFITLVFLATIALLVTGANGSEQVEAENLVDNSTTVVKGFAADPDLTWFHKQVKEAKAVLVIPQSIKGAFFVGGSGGSGALVAHDATTGDWGYPAFYTIGSVSFGLQFGGEASEVVLLIMSDRGMDKLLTSSFKLGADLTIAAGPVGRGAAAQTADVLSYARSKGAFAGVALDGAIVKTKDKFNEAYYGKSVSPTDILIRKSVSNPQADNLRKEIAAVTGK
jgi:lipid-binding SYLF domain-containing protein